MQWKDFGLSGISGIDHTYASEYYTNFGKYVGFSNSLKLDNQKENNKKDEEKDMNLMSGMNGLFARVQPGMCRLTMSGKIAVKTGTDTYKTYNVKTGRLTNCANFVMNLADEMFFTMPATTVKTGDIILYNNEPKCVIEVKKNSIEVIDYKTSTIQNLVKERHIFLGNAYFYCKIVSLFGNGFKNGKGTNSMMKYMLMSQMMNGKTGDMNSMMPMMLMMNGGIGDMGGMFDGLFEFDETEEVDVEEDEDVEEEE